MSKNAKDFHNLCMYKALRGKSLLDYAYILNSLGYRGVTINRKIKEVASMFGVHKTFLGALPIIKEMEDELRILGFASLTYKGKNNE